MASHMLLTKQIRNVSDSESTDGKQVAKIMSAQIVIMSRYHVQLGHFNNLEEGSK